MFKVLLFGAIQLLVVIAPNVCISMDSTLLQLTRVLEQHNLTEASRIVEQSDYKAPVIRSEWFIEKHLNGDERAVELHRRAFGYSLLGAFQALHRTVPAMARDGLVENLWICLAMSHWIDQADGYGNVMIANEGRTVALSILEMLAIDELVADEVLDNGLAKLVLRSDDSQVRIRIINDEAKSILFVDGTRGLQLASAWRAWSIRVAYQGLDVIDRRRAKVKEHAIAIGVDVDEQVPARVREFFEAEECEYRGKAWIERCWAKKGHERLLGVGVVYKSLSELVLFRKLADGFPVPRDEEGDVDAWRVSKEGKIGFIRAWDLVRGSNSRAIALSAWQKYVDVVRKMKSGR